jgi:phage terminase Nu1 subunit (DNA packaging protein)
MKPINAPESLPAEFSAAELRYLLNLTPGRLTQLEEAGIVVRTRAGYYGSGSVRNFVTFLRRSGEGPRDWQTARVELAREKLALLRLERGQLEGRLLEKEQVRSMNVSIATTIKNRLLAVPRATAPRLLHLTHASEAEAVTTDAITDALTELAALAG